MIVHNLFNELTKQLELDRKKDMKIMDNLEDYKVRNFMDSKVDIAAKRLDVSYIVWVLKNNFDNVICETIFGVKFDKEKVKKTLENRDYICFLIKSHLLNRACNLESKECSAFQIRLYHSILTFMKYQKNK